MKLLLSLLTLSLVALTGCGYTIQGHVVRGEIASVTWVNAGEHLPDGEPVAGASVSIVRDPGTLHSEAAGNTMSDANGVFNLSVSTFGAGWLSESYLVRGTRQGAGSAEWIGELPGSPSGRILVIVIAPGGGRSFDAMWKGDFTEHQSGASIMEEANKYK